MYFEIYIFFFFCQGLFVSIHKYRFLIPTLSSIEFLLNNIIQNRKMSKALIIIDVQNDFCEGGSLAIHNSNEIFPIINHLKKKKIFDHVFLSRDWHPAQHVSFAYVHGKEPFTTIKLKEKMQELWPVHCVEHTHGAQISHLLEIDSNQIVFNKGIFQDEDSYSGFGTQRNRTKLLQELQGKNIKEAYVCGLAFDFCVGSTALDAKSFGFETFIISEATKAVSDTTSNSMNKILKEKGVKIISYHDI